MADHRKMLKGNSVVIVLSMLEREPMYGYQMIKAIEKVSDGVFKFKEGTLYPILHSLETEKMIESYWWGQEGGRQRKYYRLTSKGRAELQKQRQEWAAYRSAVDKIVQGEGLAWT